MFFFVFFVGNNAYASCVKKYSYGLLPKRDGGDFKSAVGRDLQVYAVWVASLPPPIRPSRIMLSESNQKPTDHLMPGSSQSFPPSPTLTNQGGDNHRIEQSRLEDAHKPLDIMFGLYNTSTDTQRTAVN